MRAFRFFGYSIPGFLVVAATTWLSRLLTTTVSLISIRILLNTLGVEGYAAYAVLMGVTAWFMLADIGIGQSLQNYISEARANNNTYSQYIISAVLIVATAAMLSAVLIVIFGKWPATQLLNQFEILTSEDKYLSFVSISVLVIITAAGSIIYKIWYAEHRGYLANIATATAALVGLAGIHFVSASQLENKLMWCLVAAYLPLAALPIISLSIRVVATRKACSRGMSDSARSLLTRASGFWSFNIAATAVFQMDFIVLSQYAPAEQIVVYTIAAKIFAVMAFVTGAVLQAFWPECAEAVMHGNWRLIDKFTLRYLTWSILGVALFTLLFLIFNEYIVSMFSKNDTVSIPSSFIVAMGLMYVIRVWTDVYAVILQSMNDIKILLWWAVLQAFLGLGLQILLVPNYGIYGTVIALCLSWLLTVSWLAPKRVLHHKNSSGRIVT